MTQTYFDLINMILLIFSFLTLGALAGMMSERTGIVNIAIEAQMTIGALLFTLGGVMGLSIWLSFILAMLASIFVSLVHAFTTIKMKSNHIVSGLALNLLVGGLSPFIIKVVSKGVGYLTTGFKPLRLTFKGPWSMLNYYGILTFIILFIVWFVINKTKNGLRFITTGENPSALLAVGISANKQRWIGLTLSGIFAGLSGAFFTTSISGVYRGSVFGTGFVALAVLIFGQWRVKSIMIAALIFSTFNAIAYYDLDFLQFIPRDFQVAMPYLISLIALVKYSKNSKTPKAVGQKIE